MFGCAIFLTGDPITVGRRDIIKRVHSMFSYVVTLLSPDSTKKGALLDYVLHNDITLENFETAVNNLAEKIENSI